MKYWMEVSLYKKDKDGVKTLWCGVFQCKQTIKNVMKTLFSINVVK